MILDRFRLAGQVAIVTGAGRGLGLGMAAALAEAGADLVAVSRSGDIAALEERVAAAGRRVHLIASDVATLDDAGADAILAEALAQFGRVDILLNNAGITRRAKAEEFTTEDWNAVLAVNLQAVFLLCRTIGKHLVEQGHGKIINIASMLSYQGGILVPAYTASKHAVAGLTKALANEWAGRGVCVNAIAPGYMATDLTERLRDDPVRNREVNERIPAGRWGTPDDLGGTAVFLASAASDYINGQLIAVDGGWLGR